jgi:aspartate/methionine/tyrosine aminotransferase
LVQSLLHFAGDARVPRFKEAVMAIEPQLIVEIADYARQFENIMALCFGQADLTSPTVARDAVAAALDRGETFYPDVRGLAQLRTALADYTNRLYRTSIAEERIAVTASGMAARAAAAPTPG